MESEPSAVHSSFDGSGMSKAGIFIAGLEVVDSEEIFELLCFGILKLARAFLAVVASGSLPGALDLSPLSLTLVLGGEVEAKCGSII